VVTVGGIGLSAATLSGIVAAAVATAVAVGTSDDSTPSATHHH